MDFLKITFYIALAVALLVFLRLSTRIPLFTRILIALAIPLIAVLLVYFLSLLFSFIIVIIAIILVFWLFRGKRKR